LITKEAECYPLIQMIKRLTLIFLIPKEHPIAIYYLSIKSLKHANCEHWNSERLKSKEIFLSKFYNNFRNSQNKMKKQSQLLTILFKFSICRQLCFNRGLFAKDMFIKQSTYNSSIKNKELLKLKTRAQKRAPEMSHTVDSKCTHLIFHWPTMIDFPPLTVPDH
jgi:hypothetical protein